MNEKFYEATWNGEAIYASTEDGSGRTFYNGREESTTQDYVGSPKLVLCALDQGLISPRGKYRSPDKVEEIDLEDVSPRRMQKAIRVSEDYLKSRVGKDQMKELSQHRKKLREESEGLTAILNALKD